MSEKGPLRTILLNDALAAALKTVKAKQFSVGSRVYYPPGMFDKVLVTLITYFAVMDDPIANNPDDFDSLFLILMLLRISIDNQTFRNRIATDLAYNNKVRYEDDHTPKVPRYRMATNWWTQIISCF